MALEMDSLDPLECPSSLGAQSGSAENSTEVSTTNPDQLRSTKGTDKKHQRGITMNRSPVGQWVVWPISYWPCSANTRLNSRSTRGVSTDCTTHFTPRLMQQHDLGLQVCKRHPRKNRGMTAWEYIANTATTPFI